MTAVTEPEAPPKSLVADAMVALGNLILANPELQRYVQIVMPGMTEDVDIRMYADSVDAFTLWAVALEDSTTRAYRWQGKVDGEVRGRIGDVTVRVVAELPADTVSDDFGWHDWTPAVAS